MCHERELKAKHTVSLVNEVFSSQNASIYRVRCQFYDVTAKKTSGSPGHAANSGLWRKERTFHHMELHSVPCSWIHLCVDVEPIMPLYVNALRVDGYKE